MSRIRLRSRVDFLSGECRGVLLFIFCSAGFFILSHALFSIWFHSSWRCDSLFGLDILACFGRWCILWGSFVTRLHFDLAYTHTHTYTLEPR
jgi:hypothetical protein